MGVSATEDEGRHRRKRADARRRRKRGASGMLAARVAEVRLRVVWDWGKSTFEQRLRGPEKDRESGHKDIHRDHLLHHLRSCRTLPTIDNQEPSTTVLP